MKEYKAARIHRAEEKEDDDYGKGSCPAKFGVRGIVQISMGQKKFRKPKDLVRKMALGTPLVRPGGVIAGFPEFWQKSNDAFQGFFEATDHLVPLVNTVLAKPIGGQLPRVLHYMTAIISNSLGSLITLALNGYGHDAVRISRGMFETSVNAAYLAKYPTEAEDYLNYHWIRQRRYLDYMRTDDPARFQQLKQSEIDEMDAEYAKVVSRFTDSKGKVRKDWCSKNFRQRSEAVGMGKFYPTFYAYASSIHHGDISGLAAQVSTAKFRAEIAPSFQAIRDALIMGHSPSSWSSTTSMMLPPSVWLTRSRQRPRRSGKPGRSSHRPNWRP
jgi:hypothetical protein